MSTFDCLLDDDCMRDSSCDDVNKPPRNYRGNNRQTFNNRGRGRGQFNNRDQPSPSDHHPHDGGHPHHRGGHHQHGGQLGGRPSPHQNMNMAKPFKRPPIVKERQPQTKYIAPKTPDSLESENFVRRERPRTIDRRVMYNLNKLTVENFHSVTETIVDAVIDTISSADDIEKIARIILEKTLSEKEGMEMYGDLIQILHWRCALHSLLSKNETDSNDLSDVIVRILQELAQQIAPSLELTEEQLQLSKAEQAEELANERENTFAITALLGHFVVRGLMRLKIWKNLMKRLLYAPEDDMAPADHCIEGAVTSIQVCGYFLDNVDSSDKAFANAKHQLNQSMFRLQHLVNSPDVNARTKVIVKDLLETRDRQWHRKVHMDRPTTKKDIADQHQRDQILGGAVHVAQIGKVERVGSRRNLADKESEYFQYYNAQEQAYLKGLEGEREVVSEPGQ